MISRCKTSRRGCGRPASGCSPKIHDALLLATSNRSEAAVGYATMDGDTSGGLSPIAGIDKAFLRQWLRWLEQTGPTGMQPLPALAAVNRQAPTAELRPAERHQTDEDDLMPYEVLDAIERAAIRDKNAPVEVFTLLRGQFPEVAPGPMGLWVGTILPALVPQSMEARTLRAVVPLGR